MSMEILSRHWEELKGKANYLNSFVGTKFKDGKDTGVPAIVIYVSKKVAAVELTAEHLIPSEIEGFPTDVVEIAPTTWQAGKTGISQLHPEEQRRKLGAIVERNPKVMVSAPPILTGLEVDWVQWFSAIQNQGNCGICVWFGIIGVWEAIYRIIKNDPALAIKLSEACGFFCSGGTCGTGSDCPTALNYAQSKGVCLEQYLPYKDVDQACHEGILPGWDQFIQKLKSWQTTTDIDTIREWIKQGPLVAVMAVHQSFFSYQSGIYQSLGPSDPVVGYHCIDRAGMSDSKQASHLRNSWGINWGEKGCAWIAYGDSEFDNAAWLIIPDMAPLPPPSPPPPPAPPALVITTTSLPGATQNVAYSLTLQAAGGVPPYLWACGPLPEGLVLSAAGTLSGTPTVTETAQIIFTVTDSTGATAKTQLSLLINIAPGPTPSTCKIGNGIAGILNVYSRLAKRKGRFQYVNQKGDH